MSGTSSRNDSNVTDSIVIDNASKGDIASNQSELSEVNQQSVETPRGGVKRFLTPSPVQLSSLQSLNKRTRQLSGQSFIMDEEAELQTHILSSPMEPSDVTKIAFELKELMIPEIKDMINEQIPDIRSIVNESVKGMQDTLLAEIRSLRKENDTLRQENTSLKTVVELDTKVKKIEVLADSNEQNSRRNSLRITGIPMENNESTDDIVIGH